MEQVQNDILALQIGYLSIVQFVKFLMDEANKSTHLSLAKKLRFAGFSSSANR